MYDVPYGIASCYNALPVSGGSYTLSRIVLSRLAERAKDSEHFVNELLPHAVKVLCEYIEQKIEFLVEKSHFFKSNFLVKEGIFESRKFHGYVWHCWNERMCKQADGKRGRPDKYGYSEYADQLAVNILETMKECVNSFKSKYCNCTDHLYYACTSRD